MGRPTSLIKPTMRRTVLLDFDHTVALSPRACDPAGLPIAEHVRTLISELHSRGADVAWYSAREEDASELGRVLLGVDWPYVPLGTFPGTDVEQKLDGLTAWGFYDQQACYLIVDDAPPPAAWLPENTAVLKVDPDTGLSPEQCQQVLSWLQD